MPVVVAVNGALMSSAWFFLPASLKDDIFSLHGSLVFAAVLASWMYSDVPATNVLGPDSVRVRRRWRTRCLFRRLLAAKNVVLWVLITPICCLVALLIGVANHNLLSTVITVVWIGIVPFGALGLSNLVGIRFPYHPMPLRYRWDHRRPFRRMIVRWLTLALTPYVVFPAIAALLMAPHPDSVGSPHADRPVEELARDRLRVGRRCGLRPGRGRLVGRTPCRVPRGPAPLGLARRLLGRPGPSLNRRRSGARVAGEEGVGQGNLHAARVGRIDDAQRGVGAQDAHPELAQGPLGGVTVVDDAWPAGGCAAVRSGDPRVLLRL